MAQDILITPGSGEPQILFRGSGTTDTAVELNVLSSYQSGTGSGTALLFEGTEGQLFGITDNLSSGTIFSVADITGLPTIEVNSDGQVILCEYGSGTIIYNDLTGDNSLIHVSGVNLGASGVRFSDGTTQTTAVTDTNTQLSTEEVQDIAGPLVATGGTKTLITVTYDDANNDMDFVVDNDLANYDNSSAGFLTAHPTISATSSSDNSGRTYIQDVILDSNGHVTGLATATETVTDTTYTAGAGITLTGTTFDVNVNATTQTVAANTVSATSSRTYAVQVNASDELVVNVPWTDTDTDTQLSQEQVEDYAGNLIATSGTKTGITVTYQDSTNDVDFVVGGLTTTEIAASTLVTEAEGISSNDNDTTLPTSAAVKDYVDNNAGGGGTVQGTDGTYDIQPTSEGATAGNTRGEGSVDLQTHRSAATQVASGGCSVIGGGSCNTSSGSQSTVSGGDGNTASGSTSAVGGGLGNTSSGSVSTVGGGRWNTASGSISTVSGGIINTASGSVSTVGGGVSNTASGGCSTVGGGGSNTASATNSSVAGGCCNITNARHSIVAGGHRNIIQSPTNECCSRGATIGGGVGHNSSGGTLNATTGDLTGTITCCNAGAFSTIAGGLRNCATGPYSNIGGGCNNTASSISTIGGGYCNTASNHGSTVAGGFNNTASGLGSTISGGTTNTTSNFYSTVGGGQNNTASSYSAIGGGCFNTASAYNSTVGGGQNNTASGMQSTVGGGGSNTASNFYSTIGGGRSNTASAKNSSVAGGCCNITNARHSVISGGHRNIIQSPTNECSSRGATIGGGVGHNSSGGTLNATTGDLTGTITCCNAGAFSTISGGLRNVATGACDTIGGGCGNTASGSCSTVGGGQNNTASGFGSTVGGGLRAKATKYGEVAHAAGRFAADGDAQHTVLVARDSTTDATANQVLFLDGSSERLTIPAETTWMFTVKLAAHNDTDNDGGWWFFRGGIRRDASNNTTLIGTVLEDNSKDSNISSATASVVADDTNEALEIRVTGVASKNIRWVAVVDISQVSWGTP